MKIKVLILFCVLFLGIGFEGFGQKTVTARFWDTLRVEVDTVELSFKQKSDLLKTFKKGFYETMWGVGCSHVVEYKNWDSSKFYLNYFTPIDYLLFLNTSSKRNKTDLIIQTQSDALGTETGGALIWQRNNKNRFVLKEFWESGYIQRVYKQDDTLKILLVKKGCCANFFNCEELYSYYDKDFHKEYELCYPRALEMKKNREVQGYINTKDSTWLFLGSDSFCNSKSYWRGEMMNHNEKTPEIPMIDNAYAIIKSNQKIRLLGSKKEGEIYWYFVWLDPKNISNRMSDLMVGYEQDKIHIAGWMKSKTPLKIESK